MAISGELRMSVSMVVTQCEETLRTHLDDSVVATVTRAMLSAEKSDKILGKATKKYLEKSMKKGVRFFLAVLKKLELPEFVLFLESLEQIADKKHVTALTTIATHIEFLIPPPTSESELDSESPKDSLLTEAIGKLKRIREDYFKISRDPDVPIQDSQNSESFECEGLQTFTSDSFTRLPDDSVQATTKQIAEIQSMTFDDSPNPSSQHTGYGDLQTLTHAIHPDDSVQRIITQITKIHIPDDDLLLPPPDPSSQCSGSGTTDEPEIVHVPKSGAQLYSPVHGVTVTVPPSAVPSQEFELQMSASLDSTITIGSEYVLCSAIVMLTTDPKIDEFSDYIVVSMPHCAVSMQDYPEFYCVISHTDDQQSFKEDTNIEVDFTSQWGYLSFKTKHFSRFAAAGKMNKAAAVPLRRQPMRLAKLKSKSLEHHNKPPKVEAILQREFHRSLSDPLPQSRCLPDVRFGLGMFTPRYKKGSMWKVVFLTCLNNPTGYHVSYSEKF